MTTKSMYPGIASGSYNEQAIDIVADAQSITGPLLAARLGISVYQMSAINRAVRLGYLQKKRGTGRRENQINIFTPGPNMPGNAGGAASKSLMHMLLEHIAEHTPITSLALAAAFDIDAGIVSTRLAKAVRLNWVRMRLVDSKGITARKLICEYFDADLPLYRQSHAQRNAYRAPAPRAADAPAVANIVPPRTAPEFRPLNMARLGAVPQRDGAWDFRNIPSRYAELKCG